MSTSCSEDVTVGRARMAGRSSRPGRGTARAPNWTTIANVIPEVQLESAQHLDEEAAILAWRIWVLERAGYGEEAAATLAGSRDVDLHLAVDLLERGCPRETALRILL